MAASRRSILGEAEDIFDIDSVKCRKNIHHRDMFKLLQEMVISLRKGNLSSQSVDNIKSLNLTELHKAVICNSYDEVYPDVMLCSLMFNFNAEVKFQVQSLLKTSDSLSTINYRTVMGETALYFAAYMGSTALVLLLLENGAAVTSADTTDESELLGAVRTNQTFIAETLLSKGSNINVICEDWAAIHVACFQKSPSVIKLLVDNGADVSAVGDWNYAPINLLFIEYCSKQRYILQCNDEWAINRCLEELTRSPNLDPNYWSQCALGNPPVVGRALTMLSPTVLRTLLNNGACATSLFEYSKRALHDELTLYSVLYTKIGFGVADRVDRYCDCLHLLINHGVEPEAYEGHKWPARLLLRQLKYVKVTSRQPHMEPVFKLLITYCTEPQSLKSLSCRVVRRSLGHPLSSKLKELSLILPKSVQSFVLLSDIGIFVDGNSEIMHASYESTP